MDTPLAVLQPEQSAHFRQRLARVEAELVEVLRSTSAAGAPHDGVTDFKALAQVEALAAVDEAQAAKAMARLHEVQAARRRMDTGQYGLCMECGEPIDLRRLEALPETPCCASCRQLQEEQELMARRAG